MPHNNKERKKNRLTDYDYSQNGWYFVTICTRNMENFFGEINDGKMVLNEYGWIVERCWIDLPNHYKNCVLDEFVIMPNHVHGIVGIGDETIAGFFHNLVGNSHGNSGSYEGDGSFGVSAGNVNDLVGNINNIVRNSHGNSIQKNNGFSEQIYRMRMRLSNIMNGFKSSVTRIIRKELNNYSFRWQRSFYDHIIRDEESLQKIRDYIHLNPLKWEIKGNDENDWLEKKF